MPSSAPANYRKKLIEVALPLQAINEASAREKSIRHAHPSTLHLWWARQPLAACRAVLAATAGALVETIGQRAHLIDPHDLDGWRGALARGAG